ncbi:MAG: vWA domain-containing protein [Bdellovibrionota bacterium]
MKILSNNIIKLVLYLSIVVLSCNKAKFAEQVPDQPPKSGDEKGEEDKGTEETVDQGAQFRHLSLSHCEGLKISNKELDISGEENSKVVIEGELCVAPKTQTIAQEMTVLFVLDFSGSMGSNDTIGANNSCGRQESISAIVAKLKDEGGDDLTKISMGIIGFNADATLVSDFSSLDSLPQDWSQGACKNGGGTNYEAAFNMANDLLHTRAGHKVVYFISDGLPTQSSGGESQSDELGLSAAQSLREGNEELDLYAIYLGGETLNVGSAQAQILLILKVIFLKLLEILCM